MNDNQIKAITGTILKKQLMDVLSKYQEENVIKYCTSDYRVGYSGFDSDQFYAPFYVEFKDMSAWVIFPTNSIRTDRANIQQWNSFHIKKISPNVTKAFIVVPNAIEANEKEYDIFKKYKKGVEQGNLYSSIDYVLRLDDLLVMIEKL